MMELVFVDRKTGRVNFAINKVRKVDYITPSEVGYTKENGTKAGCPFPASEEVQIHRVEV